MNRESVLQCRTIYSRLRLWAIILFGVSIVPLIGCSVGVNKTAPVTIAFAQGQMAPPSSVMEQSTVQFAAVVNNDTSNAGVSWLLTCASQNASDCGSISRHTASGVPTTYIAPLSAPPGGTVTVEANSSAAPSQSVTTTITITPVVYGPVSIAFSPPPPASVVIGTELSLSVVVTNDHLGSNGKPLGYTLSLTCAVPGTCGTLNGSTYFPPSSVPAGGTVTITATSVADPTKNANATMTINPPVVTISLVLLPPASISAGAAANLGAKVTDGTTANAAGQLGVDWSVTCSGTACGSFIPQHTSNDVGGGSTVGKLTSYAAPAVAPSGGTVTIIASATADPTKQASVTLTVNPVALSDGLLTGQYAFLVSGMGAGGPAAVAGSIVADGNGNITAAEESLPGQTSLVTGISGSYFIGSDGRGMMTLDGLPGFAGSWLNGQQIFAIKIIDSAHAFMEEFDGYGAYNILNSPPALTWFGSTLRGKLELQQTSDFSIPPSGLYSLAWVHAGTSFPLNPCSGSFVCAAYYGGVVNAASGNVQNFFIDRYVDGATDAISSGGGGYGAQSFGAPLDSFGYGTANLGPYTLNCLMVDSGHIITMSSLSSDNTGFPVGHLYSQPTTPPSLAGTYVFTLAGSTPINSANGAAVVGGTPQALGGYVTSDANGNLNGYLDTNSDGALQSAPVTGTFSASAVEGRWAITLSGGGASRFAVYPTVNQGLLMFQLDTLKSGIGNAFVQTAPVPTFQGTYGASVQQVGLVNVGRSVSVGLPAGAWTDFSGQIVADASSNITGTLDIDQLNGLYLGPSGDLWTQTPGATLTGGFTADAQGRAPGTIATNQQGVSQVGTLGVIFYVVDDSTVLLLESDTQPAVGILQLQNF